MQLNNIKLVPVCLRQGLDTIPPLNHSPFPLITLNISFLCALAPLRLCGKKFVRLCEQNNHKTLTLTGRTRVFRNLFMRNEPNLNSPKSTITTCSRVVYNDFYPKTQNGTNPKRTQFFHYPKPHFSPPTCRCGFAFKEQQK